MRSTVDYPSPSPSHGGLPMSMVRGPSQVHPRRRRHSSAPASQTYAHVGHGDRMNGTVGSHQPSHQHSNMLQVLEDPNDTATAAAIAVQQLQALGADLDDEDDASICDYFSSGPARSPSPSYGNSAYEQDQHGPSYGNSNNAYGQYAPAGIQKPVQQQQVQQPQTAKKSWTQFFSGLNLSSELQNGVSADSDLTASTGLSSSNHSPLPPQRPQNLSSSSRSAPRRRMSGVAIRTAAAGAVADILSQPEETRGGDQQQAATTFSTDPPPLHRHEFQPPRRRGSGEHARDHRRTQRRHSYHPGSSAAQNANDHLRLSHSEFLRMKEELRNSSVLTNAGVQQVMARRSSIEHKKANNTATHLEEQQRLQTLRDQSQTQDFQNADKKNRFFQKGKEALLETGMHGLNALQNVLVKTLEDELDVNVELYDNDPINKMVGGGYSTHGGSRHRRSITSTTSSLTNTNHSAHSRRRSSSRRISYHSRTSLDDDDGNCLLATHGALSAYEHDSLKSGADLFMDGMDQYDDEDNDVVKPQSSISRTTATNHPQHTVSTACYEQ